MSREIGIGLALIVLCVVLGSLNSDFWGTANVLNTVRHISMLGIYALGLAFVIKTGGIDLSVGSVIGLTGVILASLIVSGTPPWMAVCIALGISVVIGTCQGALITRLGLQPFIVTLGGMLLLKGISQTLCKGGTISLGNSSFRDLADGGVFEIGSVNVLPYPVLIFLLVTMLVTYLLHFNVFGRYVDAIGGNREAAMYAGINVKRVEMTTYIISSALAGVAGVVYAAYIGQMSHTVGTAYELIGIAAVVLGGCSLRGGSGTVLGVILGSALMKVIENSINMFKISYLDASGMLKEWRLDTNWQYIVIGAVILIAVVLDHGGHLLRERTAALARRLKFSMRSAADPASTE